MSDGGRSTLGDDGRAVSMQVGAVVLFGFLVVAMATWQATVVPQQNARVEFTHHQRAVGDVQQVRDVVVSAPGERSLSSQTVEMAPEYPPRTVFVNPGPPTGTLRTAGTTDPGVNLSIDNAVATDPDVRDFWNGSTHTYNTGGLVYEPNYNAFTGAPVTIYEHSVLYNRHDGGELVTVAGQDLVDGRTLSLVTLNGSLSTTTGGSLSLDLSAVSSSTRTVSVTDGSSNITVSIVSRRSAAWWTERLSGELLANGGNVVEVRDTSLGDGTHRVTLELAGGKTYELQMAKVGVGSDVTATSGRYLTDVGGNRSVAEGDSKEVVVEVRDRYNNPVSGVTVQASTGRGSLVSARAQTGGNGRATFRYVAPADVDGDPPSVPVNLTIAGAPGAGFDASTAENVTVSVTVRNTDGSGTGGGGGGAYGTSWRLPTDASGVTCSDDVCTVDATEVTELDLVMETSPVADGARVDYAVNDTSIGTLSPKEGWTNASGANVTTFTPIADGSVTVYTSSGGDGDALTLVVENTVNDLVYNADAVAVDGPDGDATTGGVEMTFTNKHGGDVTVTAVEISAASGNVARISDEVTPNDQPRRTELYIEADGSEGWVDVNGGVDLPTTFDLDVDGFDNGGNAVLSSGSTLRLSLYEFENNGGNRVDMTGETVTVTIYYQLPDGTTEQKTVTTTVG